MKHAPQRKERKEKKKKKFKGICCLNYVNNSKLSQFISGLCTFLFGLA